MIETLIRAILEQLEQPKQDVEKNLRALLSETISQLDLVSKQELERQQLAMEQANLRLSQLQQQLAQLEQH